jgi:hypothetical protein
MGNLDFFDFATIGIYALGMLLIGCDLPRFFVPGSVRGFSTFAVFSCGVQNA